MYNWGCMGKKNVVRLEGTVIEKLPNALFRVKLDNDLVIVCPLEGKMKIHYIRIVPGDRVTVEMSPYDLSRGRIVYRYK